MRYAASRAVISNHTIRLATLADAVAIAALSRAEIEHGLPWSWRAPRVRQAIADPDANVIVVGRPGRWSRSG